MDAKVALKVDTYFSTFPKRSYPKGQILIFGEENPEHIFYLVTGKVKQYDISYRGDEIIVNVYKPPAFFSMSWAINHTPNRYFYTTEEPTEVHVVPVQDAMKFIQENPDVALDLLSRLYRGVDSILERMCHLMSGTARSRLIFELIIECRRFGIQNTDNSYTLSTREIDLAGRSGLSRETVSREIHKLKNNKYLSIKRGALVVNDVAALEALLGSEI